MDDTFCKLTNFAMSFSFFMINLISFFLFTFITFDDVGFIYSIYSPSTTANEILHIVKRTAKKKKNDE